MILNSDAVNNCLYNRFNFETGQVSTDDVAGELDREILFSGVVAKLKATEAISQLNLVAYDNTNNGIGVADLDAAADYPAIGIALDAATASGQYIRILMWGYIKAEALDFGVRATGTVTIDGNVADEEIIEINGTTYQFTDDGTVTDSAYKPLDISGGVDKATAQAALSAALTTYESDLTWGEWASDVLTVTSTYVDIAATANAITLSKTGTNIAVSGATLSGGTNGNKLWLGDAGAISKTVSSTSTEYNQLVGQALSMKEALISPDMYGLVVA